MPEHLDHYRGKTVLVTGGAGSIGSNLSRALAGLGATVIVLDDLSSAPPWNLPEDPSVLFVEGSVVDEARLDDVFQRGPSLVFHLAALFANQNSVDHPELDLTVNGMGTLRILQRSASAGVERFVFASSSSIYASDAALPLNERARSLLHETPYQITKVLGEMYCDYFHLHQGLDVVKPRLFNSYGPGEAPGRYRNVIPNFVHRAMSGLPLMVTGTGDETRDFTYVGDIVDGLLRLGFCPDASGHSVNLGSGRETRIADLAEAVNRLTGNGAGVHHRPRRDWDSKSRRCADISKAKSLAGYDPATSLEEGLERTVSWFRDNWDSIGPAVSGLNG
ncbi:MAG: NAD-dependent epimerase/dehydratase family protein [Dehalococcoidia bacterium]|nr:NAD-dependent epimerase/dehydratase family protein [Dehalococcoidia bacterium]